MSRHTAREMRLAWFAILVAAVPLLWLVGIERETESLLRIWAKGQVQDFVSGWNGPDNVIRSAPGTGDVALTFINQDDAPAAAWTVSQIAHKSAYELYPRRVLSAAEGTVVEEGAQILANPYQPGEAWIRQNGPEAIHYFVIDHGLASRATTRPALPGGR